MKAPVISDVAVCEATVSEATICSHGLWMSRRTHLAGAYYLEGYDLEGYTLEPRSFFDFVPKDGKLVFFRK